MMAKLQTPLLEERIKAFQAELDSFIDERVAELKKDCPGVPEPVLRAGLIRNVGCQCQAVLAIREQDIKDAANGAA